MSPLDTSPDLPAAPSSSNAPRRHWMAVLAKASVAELERAWSGITPQPKYEMLRNPETGLVMVRGRIGGTGGAFNLGEMSMTRCAVRIAGDGASAAVGFAFVAGRDRRHAELAAVFDALLQDERRREQMQRDVIEPLAAAQSARKRETLARSAATKVDFFTMVRE